MSGTKSLVPQQRFSMVAVDRHNFFPEIESIEQLADGRFDPGLLDVKMQQARMFNV
jgi:hypothetical protein